MNPNVLINELTDIERNQFETNGYLIIENALTAKRVAKLLQLADQLDTEYRSHKIRNIFTAGLLSSLKESEMTSADISILNTRKQTRSAIRNFVTTDPLAMDLMDCPTTFPKVWGILGYNIQLHLSRLVITPPLLSAPPESRERLQWHQDSECLNIEMESIPRPRVSVKVGFFLTDTREDDCGNFYVIPGSHLINELEFPTDGVSDPANATPLRIPAGGAVIFDRRIWHAPSPNYSSKPRKVVFLGYSYRWIRQRDEMQIGALEAVCTPIRKQLLGISSDAPKGGYISPREKTLPLYEWLADHKNQLHCPTLLTERVPKGQREDYCDKPLFV